MSKCPNKHNKGGILWVTYFKCEVKFDLGGCVEAVVASEATKRPSKWVQNI